MADPVVDQSRVPTASEWTEVQSQWADVDEKRIHAREEPADPDEVHITVSGGSAVVSYERGGIQEERAGVGVVQADLRHA